MRVDCGAIKEAVMLLIVSVFQGCGAKRTGGVAGLQQPPVGTIFATFPKRYFLAAGGPDGSLK
jgi:hypothetical protein